MDWRSTRQLSFLETWQSPIADQDQEQLTLVGSLEAQSLGVQMSQRYLGFKAPAKVWTSTAERTVKSAQSLIAGLVRRQNETALVQVLEGEEQGGKVFFYIVHWTLSLIANSRHFDTILQLPGIQLI